MEHPLADKIEQSAFRWLKREGNLAISIMRFPGDPERVTLTTYFDDDKKLEVSICVGTDKD